MTDTPPSPQTAVRAPRVWTLSAGGRSVDGEVTAYDSDRLDDVFSRLLPPLGRPVSALWSASSRLAGDLPLTAPELAHGAILGLDGPVPGDRRQEASALELRVTRGPHAGR